jgi:hypothetical protein
LEQASSHAQGARHLTGTIESLDVLLDPENLARLEGLAGTFCFLAYDARADGAVTDYVRTGTLADDSGPDVLVLLAVGTPVPAPVRIESADSIDVAIGVHPAYQLVRMLFDANAVPALPGLVFFHGLLTEQQAVYIPLADLHTESDVRSRLRTVFAMAEHAGSQPDGTQTLSHLCLALRRGRIEYMATVRTSLREWLIRAFRLVRGHAGDIATVVGILRSASGQ